jgi:hypothetical protein
MDLPCPSPGPKAFFLRLLVYCHSAAEGISFPFSGLPCPQNTVQLLNQVVKVFGDPISLHSELSSVLDPVLGAGDTEVNTADKNPAL